MHCRKIQLNYVALTSLLVNKCVIGDHYVDQEEFQMEQLPEISIEQPQEHLNYIHMSSAEDHPWSKSAKGKTCRSQFEGIKKIKKKREREINIENIWH